MPFLRFFTSPSTFCNVYEGAFSQTEAITNWPLRFSTDLIWYILAALWKRLRHFVINQVMLTFRYTESTHPICKNKSRSENSWCGLPTRFRHLSGLFSNIFQGPRPPCLWPPSFQENFPAWIEFFLSHSAEFSLSCFVSGKCVESGGGSRL